MSFGFSFFSEYEANLNENGLPPDYKRQIALNTNKRHTLRRNAGDYGCTTHWTDSEDSNITAPRGRKKSTILQNARRWYASNLHVCVNNLTAYQLSTCF
jgi:hypothetical protein